MNEIVENTVANTVGKAENSYEIAKKSLEIIGNMANAEKALLEMPQVECSVVHHFGPNLCIREVFMPAGTLAIGHKQKFEHMNIMLSGKVMVVDDNGNTDVSHETARAQSENLDDQTHINCGIIKVADSPIEGKGLFLTSSVKAGDVICQARIDGKRTQAGRYTNHSMNPNAKFVYSDNGDIYLVATKDISGCVGGQNWDEVTVCYRQALSLARLR